MDILRCAPALARNILLVFMLLRAPAGALAQERTSEAPVDWEERLERLRAVPYVSFSADIVDESDTGVVIYDPKKACDGYNLYSTMRSGEALLMDMKGRMAHRWTYFPIGGIARYSYVLMLENGDLVVVKKNRELLRLSWDSELIWRKELAVHHDVAQASDGSLYMPIQELKEHHGREVIFDAIVHLRGDGDEIERWSTYDHLDQLKGSLDTRSFLDTILDSARVRSRGGGDSMKVKHAIARRPEGLDYFHVNTVNLLPANALEDKDARFKRGNLLVCFRNVDQIAVLERNTYRVLWAWGAGELEWPHHPTMLADGHILVFDNGVRRLCSRVVELDPLTDSIVWEYIAEPPGSFYSYSRGSAQRLPNGNTLIGESDKGRAFEVTQEGEVVWQWINPVTTDGHCETFYRMMRLPQDQVDQLLERR